MVRRRRSRFAGRGGAAIAAGVMAFPLSGARHPAWPSRRGRIRSLSGGGHARRIEALGVRHGNAAPDPARRRRRCNSRFSPKQPKLHDDHSLHTYYCDRRVWRDHHLRFSTFPARPVRFRRRSYVLSCRRRRGPEATWRRGGSSSWRSSIANGRADTLSEFVARCALQKRVSGFHDPLRRALAMPSRDSISMSPSRPRPA